MSRDLWDREAGSFDDEPDHGLTEGPTMQAD